MTVVAGTNLAMTDEQPHTPAPSCQSQLSLIQFEFKQRCWRLTAALLLHIVRWKRTWGVTDHIYFKAARKIETNTVLIQQKQNCKIICVFYMIQQNKSTQSKRLSFPGKQRDMFVTRVGSFQPQLFPSDFFGNKLLKKLSQYFRYNGDDEHGGSAEPDIRRCHAGSTAGDAGRPQWRRVGGQRRWGQWRGHGGAGPGQ